MVALRSARSRRALPLASGAEGDRAAIPLPERLLILPWGESRALDGSPVVVNDTTLAGLAANQAKIGAGEVPLDFEHNTLPRGEKGRAADPIPVAGYGVLSVVAGEGIYYTPVTWTDLGEQYYTGGHYRDLSATPLLAKDGTVLAVDSVALTRKGQIEGIRAFSADSLKALSALLCPEEPETDTNMDPHKAALLKLLKLPETATDEEITAAIAAAEKGETKPEETPATATPLSAEARLDALERRQLLADAKAAGKILPLSVESASKLPLSALREMIDGLKPGQVPVEGVTPAAGAEGDQKPKALSASDTEACRLLGVDTKRFQEVNA